MESILSPSIPAKVSAIKKLRKEVPTVLEMMETDSELKDLFRLIRDTNANDQVVALLRSKLEASRNSRSANLPS
jgi:PII-like signaling protein